MFVLLNNESEVYIFGWVVFESLVVCVIWKGIDSSYTYKKIPIK